MKLTKKQLAEIYNQHEGTGYAIIKLNDNTIRILSISLGKSGKWFAGDGKPLQDRLTETAKEIEACNE